MDHVEHRNGGVGDDGPLVGGGGKNISKGGEGGGGNGASAGGPHTSQGGQIGGPGNTAGGSGGISKYEAEESETDSEASDVSASDEEDQSWISWFCSLKGNEFFCEVDEEYIQDDFNLSGLNNLVMHYDFALDLILDVESPNEDILTEEQHEMVESAAELLYGLIHARYILTSRGMTAMLEKYKSADFGRCPRVFCGGQPCLPVGQADIPRSATVKIFCPKCEEIYFARSRYNSNIDGAYFGTTFPHLFLMTHGQLKPPKPQQTYVPRIFGFKIHESAVQYAQQAAAQAQASSRR